MWGRVGRREGEVGAALGDLLARDAAALGELGVAVVRERSEGARREQPPAGVALGAGREVAARLART
jgi:hypothetical protein